MSHDNISGVYSNIVSLENRMNNIPRPPPQEIFIIFWVS